MNAEEKEALRGEALVDFHRALSDENAHQAKLDGLMARLAIIHERGRNGQPPATKGLMPNQDEVAAASSELAAAKIRTANARKRCRDLEIDLQALTG